MEYIKISDRLYIMLKKMNEFNDELLNTFRSRDCGSDDHQFLVADIKSKLPLHFKICGS